MKAVLLSCFLFLSLVGSSQDTARLRLIDAHVQLIQSSVLKNIVDSAKINLPDGTMTQRFLVILSYRDTALLDKAETRRIIYPLTAYGMKDTMHAGSVIWYRDNQMIKIEEWFQIGQEEKKTVVSYFDRQLIHTSLPNKDQPDRTPIQKSLAESYLAGFRKLRLSGN